MTYHGLVSCCNIDGNFAENDVKEQSYSDIWMER